MAIQIAQEQQDATRILVLTGRLDTETAADLELVLQDQFGAGDRDFLIDLGGIGYVSSAGLRVLLALAKKLDGGKGSLRLCQLNPAVREVFEIAGFSKLFAIFPDRDAALGQRPRIDPAIELAQQASAILLGITASRAKMHPNAAELARVAAQLLGIKQVAPITTSGPLTQARHGRGGTSSPSLSTTSAPPAGFIAKLRRLFGSKH